MQLKHLIIMIFCWSLPALLVSEISMRIFGIDRYATPGMARAVVCTAFVVMLPVALEIAWGITKRFGFSPFMAFAGPCPHCGKSPRAWGWMGGSWRDKMSLACFECRGVVVVFGSRRNAEASPPAKVPRYWLRWPQFLGIWRRM